MIECRSLVMWERRRRVIVAGRAFHDDGTLFVDADSMSLVRTSEAGVPTVAKRKDKRADAVPRVGEATGRRHACHIRSDGRFFFLDVPPGRYVLQRTDRNRAVAQSKDVQVPAFDEKTALPVVSIEFEIARPAIAK